MVVQALAIDIGRVGRAGRAELGLGVGQVGRAARQDMLVVGRAAVVFAGVGEAMIPGHARTGVAVMADEGAPRTLGRILMRAVEDMPAEEDHITGLGFNLDLGIVVQGDPRQGIDGDIGVAGRLDRVDIAKDGIALPRRAVAIGVDRLMLRAGRHPQAAVVFVGGVYRQPGAYERIRLGRDVVGVLVEALARLPRLLEEEHGLQRQDIGADQGFQHIDDARMQQETLSQLAGAVRHVNALVVKAALGFAYIRRRGGNAGDGRPAGHHAVGERRQISHFVRRDQALDAVTLASESHVVRYTHSIRLMRS